MEIPSPGSVYFTALSINTKYTGCILIRMHYCIRKYIFCKMHCIWGAQISPTSILLTLSWKKNICQTCVKYLCHNCLANTLNTNFLQILLFYMTLYFTCFWVFLDGFTRFLPWWEKSTFIFPCTILRSVMPTFRVVTYRIQTGF